MSGPRIRRRAFLIAPVAWALGMSAGQSGDSRALLSFSLLGPQDDPSRPGLFLEIRASGATAVRLPGSRAHDESHFDRESLSELMDFVVDRHRAFRITNRGIDAAIIKSGKPVIHVADAPETWLCLGMGRRQHQVRVEAVALRAAHYPEVVPLQDLHAIQTRLLAEARAITMR